MNDDERRRAIDNLTAGFESEHGPEVVEFDDEARDALIAVGVDEDQVDDILTVMRAFPPKKDGEKPKPGDKAKGGDSKAKPEADPKKPCNCDKVEGKHTVGDHKKTSSGGEGKKPPFEKKSEDGESEAPAVGSDDSEPRSEAPDDAAQAGTSKGMSKNARERAIRLLDI